MTSFKVSTLIILLSFFSLSISAVASQAASSIVKRDAIFTEYIAQVGPCRLTQSSFFHEFIGYFNVMKVTLKKSWLENDLGIIPGSLENIVSKTTDVQKGGIYAPNSVNPEKNATASCELIRESHQMRLTSAAEINQAIEDFKKSK